MTHADTQLVAAGAAHAERFSFADTPALTAALRTGDEAAYRWLYEQWHARLSRYCFALAHGNDALAGEITQAAYLRLVRHVRVLPDAEALWNWLACAARSAAIDLGRTVNRYRGALSRFSALLHGQLAEPRVDETEAVLLRALDAALAQLTAEERDLINARYFAPVPLEETAARLQLTTRAVEGRLARLRQRLRELITTELKRHDA
jgi:RNA polymerase sigma factor (sigma-70 family)